MENTTTVTAAYDFSQEQIAGILKAFTDSNVIPVVKSIYVYHVSKQMTGYGHWKLSVTVEIDGEKFELSNETTDSMMIDSWSEDGELNLDTLVSAFDSVITANEYEIQEAFIADENETDSE